MATFNGPGSERHLSAHLHVTGRSRFITDEPVPPGMLQVKVLVSPHAHARIRAIALDRARAMPGVAAVLTARDIPGENQIGMVIKDEPLLAQDKVCYVGQPVAIVVGRTAAEAAEAARAIEVTYEPLAPVFEAEQALKLGSLYAPERKIERGDIAAGFAAAEFTLDGSIVTGSQEHMYLETQRTRAIPGEDQEVLLFPATQSPGEVQEVAARVLGLDRKDVTVDVKRLGGGFGGKESGATLWACLAALACHRTRRPVELCLTRVEDMSWTGKRHPFHIKYRVGFNRDGRLVAYDAEFNINGGAFTDLSLAILERGMLHADNAYFIPNVRVIGRACRTNLPPNTALRGFGAPQGIFAIETVIERIARRLSLDRVAVRRLNVYRDGQETHYGQPVAEAATDELLARLLEAAQYAKLRDRVREFNRGNRDRKQGIGVVPVKFGISFTSSFLNQGSALVWVYADGTISVSHGGIEMGQGVNTKVAQIVAHEFGVGLGQIRVESSSTRRVGNASPTAASTGADINGNAARLAAQAIVARLRPLAAELLAAGAGNPAAAAPPDPEQIVFQGGMVFDRRAPEVRLAFRELSSEAHRQRVNLGAQAFYRTPDIGWDRATGRGRPFSYFVFGCCLAIAEVDALTGSVRVREAHIVHETGRSLNPALDQGQIEGAFIQGMGWFTTEEVVRDEHGRLLSNSPSTYKIPTVRDLPDEFRVTMIDRDRSCASVLGSKAVGEPPLVYGEAVWFAVRDAVEAVAGHRFEANLRPPATPESVLAAIEELGERAGQ